MTLSARWCSHHCSNTACRRGTGGVHRARTRAACCFSTATSVRSASSSSYFSLATSCGKFPVGVSSWGATSTGRARCKSDSGGCDEQRPNAYQAAGPHPRAHTRTHAMRIACHAHQRFIAVLYAAEGDHEWPARRTIPAGGSARGAMPPPALGAGCWGLRRKCRRPTRGPRPPVPPPPRVQGRLDRAPACTAEGRSRSPEDG